MAANRRGQRSSEDHRRKIAESLTGRLLSEEHRRKMAAVNADPELLRQKAETRKAWRTLAESHRQMHKRLTRDRGSATNYQCVDCSAQAQAWTHSWTTWENIAQDLCGKRLTFSTNPEVYEPRCHSCHNTLDHRSRSRPWDLPL